MTTGGQATHNYAMTTGGQASHNYAMTTGGQASLSAARINAISGDFRNSVEWRWSLSGKIRPGN